MMQTILKFRYIFIVAVVLLMINSSVFLVAGVVHCYHGYAEFINTGFNINDTNRIGVYLLEALDFFMIALVFMIFSLGMGRLFLFDHIPAANLPRWLRISGLSELKMLLWETILLTLVIFCITHLARSELNSPDVLIFPGVILILSLSLFFIKWHKSRRE